MNDAIQPHVHSEYVATRGAVNGDGSATVTITQLWALFDCYCMKCHASYPGIASVNAESGLWVCPQCNTLAVEHRQLMTGTLADIEQSLTDGVWE